MKVTSFSSPKWLISQVLYSYAIGFVYILFGLVVSGGIFDAFQFCMQVSYPDPFIV